MQPPTSKVGSDAAHLADADGLGRATRMECGGLPPLWGVGLVPGPDSGSKLPHCIRWCRLSSAIGGQGG